MFIVTAILAALLGAGFIMSGMGKLTGAAMMETNREHLGIEPTLWKAIGALDVLGGAGVLVGLHADLPIIGVLAGSGLVAMTIGAVFYHQQAGDAIKDWLPAVLMGSLAIIYIVLRIATS